MTNVQKIGAGVALTALFTTGVVFAQVVPTVSTFTTPPSVLLTPGSSGQTVTSVTLTGNQSGSYQLASVPVTLTPINGAVAGNLTNCQAFNSSGQAISGNFGTAVSGVNNISFSSPFTIAAGTPTTISIRCDVASTTLAGSVFNFASGVPVFAPGLAVNLAVSPSVAPGQQNAAVALIQLDATRSGVPIRLSSIPVSASFAGASNFTSCQVRNLANLGVGLNTGANIVGSLGSGVNTFTLDTPFTVSAGTSATLVVTCDVSAGAALGSSATFSVAPSGFPSVSGTTGAAVTAVSGGPAGTTGITSGTLTISNTPAPTPGVPNTGEGGDAGSTMLLLALFGLAAASGAGYLLKRSLK